MKILVATARTQGQRSNDFRFVPEGEPLMPGQECKGEEVDGRCGCRRSLTGVECRKATTTALVTEVRHDRRWLTRLFRRSLMRVGLRPEPGEVKQLVDRAILMASSFATGTVIERRGDECGARQEQEEGLE